jgi:hypothetical protein
MVQIFSNYKYTQYDSFKTNKYQIIYGIKAILTIFSYLLAPHRIVQTFLRQ